MGCVIWPYGCILFETFYCLPLSSSYKTAHGHWPHVNVCRVSCGGVVNTLSFRLPLIFITIYGFLSGQLAHFDIGDWKDLSTAHVIIIIKLEVSTFPIVIIFFRGCVSEMFLTSYSVTYCIKIPGKPGLFMVSANNRIRFVLKIVFVCLYITQSHYHHCANLSEDIELVKCLSDIYLSSV